MYPYKQFEREMRIATTKMSSRFRFAFFVILHAESFRENCQSETITIKTPHQMHLRLRSDCLYRVSARHSRTEIQRTTDSVEFQYFALNFFTTQNKRRIRKARDK